MCSRAKETGCAPGKERFLVCRRFWTRPRSSSASRFGSCSPGIVGGAEEYILWVRGSKCLVEVDRLGGLRFVPCMDRLEERFKISTRQGVELLSHQYSHFH